MDTVRYGGVHQGLSGARRVDITGFRTDYSFSWTYLEQSEYLWLDALYTRQVPGPHRLISPLKKNRLSTAAAQGRMSKTVSTGVQFNFSYASYPSEIVTATGVPAQGRQLFAWATTGTSDVLFDPLHRTPVFPLETITGSVWLRFTGTVGTPTLGFDYYDRTGTFLSSSSATVTASSSWVRNSVTRTVPAGCAAVRLRLTLNPHVSGANALFSSPQLETGNAATTWESGGGAPTVLLDQLSTSSPRFPLRDCSMTLLEC